MTLRSGRLRYQVQLTDARAAVTAHAGLPLVIEAFRALGLPQAIEEHLHFKQRLRGVEDLGQSSDPRAVNHLLKAMGDADLRVQARAIDYLGARRASDATPLLVQKLFLAGAPGPLRQRVLTSLGRIGDPSASRPILDFLAQEQNADVRGTAIYALGEIGDVTIRDELVKLGDEEKDPRL